jgi:alpha-D-ribose 1-methylphosphonate 5-triphosphate synthase subunit PhnL
MSVVLETRGLSKDFTLHLQGGLRLPVLSEVALTLHAGECVALHGPSGAGKSTLMRSIYANYRASTGWIRILHQGAMVDLTSATPRTVLEVRKHSLGYVSQFLRVVPRVPAIEIVAEVAAARESPDPTGEARALLRRFNLPDRLHGLPPATFSGGEQQRVNLARGFAGEHPILLLDEPTASLDHDNRDAVIQVILGVKQRGVAILGIFHDGEVRRRVADRLFAVT